MQEFLPFIIAGIAAGSIYGLAATGLVLTYKTSGIFNFGQGALATAAAYLKPRSPLTSAPTTCRSMHAP